MDVQLKRQCILVTHTQYDEPQCDANETISLNVYSVTYLSSFLRKFYLSVDLTPPFIESGTGFEPAYMVLQTIA